MFDALRSPPQAEKTFDANHFYERLAELLVESGLSPDDRVFFAMHKMIADDVAWYLDVLAANHEPSSSAT